MSVAVVGWSARQSGSLSFQFWGDWVLGSVAGLGDLPVGPVPSKATSSPHKAPWARASAYTPCGSSSRCRSSAPAFRLRFGLASSAVPVGCGRGRCGTLPESRNTARGLASSGCLDGRSEAVRETTTSEIGTPSFSPFDLPVPGPSQLHAAIFFVSPANAEGRRGHATGPGLGPTERLTLRRTGRVGAKGPISPMSGRRATGAEIRFAAAAPSGARRHRAARRRGRRARWRRIGRACRKRRKRSAFPSRQPSAGRAARRFSATARMSPARWNGSAFPILASRNAGQRCRHPSLRRPMHCSPNLLLKLLFPTGRSRRTGTHPMARGADRAVPFAAAEAAVEVRLRTGPPPFARGQPVGRALAPAGCWTTATTSRHSRILSHDAPRAALVLHEKGLPLPTIDYRPIFFTLPGRNRVEDAR